ncbi:MAG: hypothetical protein A3F18_06285 [Legionellales bacterium RIFCSPHIGHO2_12_FULL_37_14]|nr:MAG: hypothetical protein A3F18_06285 [Legionellales bacterium RIFCSPHIGHO2_12_FULL_37_14]
MPTPFFTTTDLLFLKKKNLGLRLTNKHDEATKGGSGDAIPLSHLAGADDIIEFLTLAFQSNAPKRIERMQEIYMRYKENDIKETSCMPRLILYYAAEHNIDDAKERLKYAKGVCHGMQFSKLAKEAETLVAFNKSTQIFYPIVLIVTNLPTLAQELTDNFNEKLNLRLSLNWNSFATSDDMDYLFLTDSEQNPLDYTSNAYDLNHYPLGKGGSRQFAARNVVDQIMFMAGDNRTPGEEIHIKNTVVYKIKLIIGKEELNQISDLEGSINFYLNNGVFPAGFRNACNKMLTAVSDLYSEGYFSRNDTTIIMTSLKKLISNPRNYPEFLNEAKKYSKIAGGKLAAYMMLIAGWAAKIISLNHVGDAWIRLAHEKLDYIAATEELAEQSIRTTP